MVFIMSWYTPTKYNDIIKERILAELRKANFRSTAAMNAGITPTMLSRWMKESDAGNPNLEGFADAVRKAEAKAEGKCVDNIMLLAEQRGDWRAYQWVMERRFRKNWGADATGDSQDASAITDAAKVAREASRNAFGSAPPEKDKAAG